MNTIPRLLLGLTLAAASATHASPPPPAPALPVPPIVSEPIPEWQARWELARILSYAGNYDESLAEYRRVLTAKPDLSAARAEYGQVLGWAGRTEDAVRELSSLPADALPPAGAVLLADLLLGQNKFAESTRLYRQALSANPDDAPTRFKLARALSWQKLLSESLAEFETLLKAHPADAQIRRHYAQVLGWAGRNEDAAREWRRSLTP